MTAEQNILDRVASGFSKPYRGQIWENCKRFKLVGKAYEAMPREQNGHFRIESARHLMWILLALLDPAVRKVIVIGATQVLKSILGDIWTTYVMEHNPRNMLVLFEDDPKAKLFCDARLMDTIKQHPILSKQILGVDRHDATKTKIKLATMLLQAGGLNDGNVSSLSWPLIWISEGWQHKNDGLLFKAIKRADRFPDDCKILIESQAGQTEEDLHRVAMAAHQVPLTWACPLCGARQSWETPNEFGRIRDDGTFSGMKFDPSEKEINGVLTALNIQQRASSAHWECHHCRGAIQDTKQNRQQIMDSYEQDYKITTASGEKISPESVCFYLPFESARDNSFSKTVTTYLTAKNAQRLGDMIPIANWYMAERAMFWHKSLVHSQVPVITGSYNIEGTIPDEVCRVMSVDCQQDPGLTQATGKPTTGHFWYVVRVIDKNSNQFQMARGYAKSWDELIAVQDFWKIQNQNVGIDGAFFRSDVIDMAAAKIRPYTVRVKKHGRWVNETFWFTWTVLVGDSTGKGCWKWPDAYWRSISPMQPQIRPATIGGKQHNIKVPLYYWGNLAVKDQLNSLRMGGQGKPSFTKLPVEKLSEATRLVEQNDLTYDNQMSAEWKTLKKNGDPTYEKLRPNNHYFDCECECQCLFGLGGYLGNTVAVDTSPNAA